MCTVSDGECYLNFPSITVDGMSKKLVMVGVASSERGNFELCNVACDLHFVVECDVLVQTEGKTGAQHRWCLSAGLFDRGILLP